MVLVVFMVQRMLKSELGLKSEGKTFSTRMCKRFILSEHPPLQLLAVKHLAQSEAKEEEWHEIMILALRAALRIKDVDKSTADARSVR